MTTSTILRIMLCCIFSGFVIAVLIRLWYMADDVTEIRRILKEIDKKH